MSLFLFQGKWSPERDQVRVGARNSRDGASSQVTACYQSLWSISKFSRINNECIKNREARIGIDLVKDEVENSLEREVENIKTYQQRMQKMLARVNQQIETNHSMQDKLHGDLEHKDMALEIDRDCAEMHNDAIDIKHHDGIEEEDVSGSVPQSWAKFSKNNVEESQCEYSSSSLSSLSC